MVSSLLLDGTSLIDVIQQQKMEFVDRLRNVYITPKSGAP